MGTRVCPLVTRAHRQDTQVRELNSEEEDAMDVELVLEAHATMGESPTWALIERALYWIDVKAPALYRYDPETGGNRGWPLPS